MLWSNGVVSRRTVVCVICVSVVLSLTPAFAQSTASGTVSGQVTDPTGAVVPGATVTLTDVATHEARTTTSNEAGRYIFVNINPGTYDIGVTSKGFVQARIPAQKVVIGSVISGNVVLQVGAANEVVEVQAEGAALQTMNATVGTTVEFQNLQELPNLGRDVTALMVVQPGVSSNGSVAGAVRDQNTFQLDGGNNSDDMAGTGNTYTVTATAPASMATNGTVAGVIPAPVESIEEFKVNVANQTADFNGSSGAQVQMVTRRGTDAWHGALYDFYLGSNFGANSWVNDHTPLKNGAGQVVKPFTPLPSNHYNRFGASAGGPIAPRMLGGKTYLFANYEGRRYPQNTTVDKLSPTPLMRLGVIQVQDASGKYQPYNLNPVPVTYNGVTYAPASCASSPNGLCDPRGIGLNSLVSQIWNKQMPLPNDATAGDTVNTQGYLTSLKLPQNDNFGVVRLDHDFGANWHFMSSYRYYHLQRAVNVQYDIGGVLPGDTFGVATATANRPQVPWYYVAGLTSNLTHNLTNSFTYSYLRNYWAWQTGGAPAQLPGLGGALEMGGEVSTSLIPYNVRTQDARTRNWDGHDNGFRDDLTLIHGNHVFQFGGQYQRNWDLHTRNDNGLGTMAWNVYIIGASGTASSVTGLSVTGFVPSTVPSSQVNNYRTLYSEVLGIVTQPQTLYSRALPDMSLQPFGSPVNAHVITNSYNVYFGDSWHMKPNFTFTYGLGYQLELPPYAQDGKQVVVVDQAGNPIRGEDYLAQRKQAALKGQVYDPVLGFEALPNVNGGHRKYPYDVFYGGFSPRVAAAWNPRFDSGILGKIFGSNQTVVRGGWGLQYGRANGVLNILTPLLLPSFLQAVSCQGAVKASSAVNGSQCLGTGGANPSTAFRIGTDGTTAPLPSAAPTIAQPFLPGLAGAAQSGDAIGLDSKYRPSAVHSIDLTIQRELTNKMFVEIGYIGRIIQHELDDVDLNSVPYMTTLGGQSFADAYAKVYTGVCGLAGGPCVGNAYTGADQPFFEAALGGKGSAYCGATSCTQAVASKQASQIKLGSVFDLWQSMSSSSAWTLGRTLPQSNPPGGCVVSATSVCSQLTSLQMSLANGYGNYNAAFVSFRLRDWHGMTGETNLTWGRALGTGAVTQSSSGQTITDPWRLRVDYGPQLFDTKLLYHASLVYHVPYFKSQAGLLGRLAGGWGISPLFTAQSGLPFEVDSGSDCQSFGESSCSTGALENAVRVGSVPGMSSNYNVHASGSAGANGNPPAGVGLNTFANPQAVYNSFRRLVLGVDTNAGGAGRLWGLPRWTLDLGITKETRFTERTGATFFATISNILNHFQPSDPTSMSIDSPGNWGVVKGAATGYDQRQMELGLRVHF